MTEPNVVSVKKLVGDAREITFHVPPSESGAKAATSKVVVQLPERPVVRNEAGWQLTESGEWMTPVVEVDGEFVPRDETWAVDDSMAESDLLAPVIDRETARISNTHTAMTQLADVKSGDSFSSNGITVKYLKKPDLSSDGWITVNVLAVKSNGDILNVDDGEFRYFNPPSDWNAQQAIVQTVFDLNGVS